MKVKNLKNQKRVISSLFLGLLAVWGMMLALQTNLAAAATTAGEVCFAEVNGAEFSSIDGTAVQDAVDNAAGHHLIRVAGNCVGVETINGVTQTVYIDSLSDPLTIQGGYAISASAGVTEGDWSTYDPDLYETILDGAGLGRVVYITGTSDITLTNLVITNGVISGSLNGGGIFASHSSVLLSNLSVQNNSATDSGGGVAVISNTQVTVEDSNLAYNAAVNDGGGIYVGDGSMATVTNSTIHNNTTDDQDGGAISVYVDSAVVISGSMLYSNESGDNGGAVYVGDNSTAIVSSNTISNNEAADYGGGVYVSTNSTATVESNTISYNLADGDHGGGIAIRNSVATIHDNIISHNASDERGAGILISEAFSTTITNNTIHDNVVDGDNEELDGGGIAVVFGYTATNVISGNTIFNNSSADNGGGIYVSESMAVIASNTITNNEAADYGGGIYVSSDSDVTIQSNTVSSNTAANTHGGGIAIRDSDAVVENNLVTQNRSDDRAGGIYIDDAYVWLTNNIISENTALDLDLVVDSENAEGGAIYLNNASTAIMTGNTIYGNSAFGNGGAIYMEDEATMNMVNNTVSANEGSLGGALYAEGGATIAIRYSTIVSNRFTSFVESFGGVYVVSPTVNVLIGESIIAYNDGADCNGTMADNGYNLDSDGTCGWADTNSMSSVDPVLAALADNDSGVTAGVSGEIVQTHAVDVDSSAVDAIPSGTNGCGTDYTTDQRGVERAQNDACTIGALEYVVTEFILFLPFLSR